MHTSPAEDPAIVSHVLAHPLRKLSNDAIGAYAGSAIFTIGDPQDYQHFLPRVLELAVTGGGWVGGEAWAIANKLVYARWETWELSQKNAVFAFFADAFRWAIDARSEQWSEPKSWLYGSVKLGLELQPLLDDWRASGTPQAAYHLADFYSYWTRANDEGELIYWDGVVTRVWQEVGLWLHDPVTRLQIAGAMSEIDDHERWALEAALVAIDGSSRH